MVREGIGVVILTGGHDYSFTRWRSRALSMAFGRQMGLNDGMHGIYILACLDVEYNAIQPISKVQHRIFEFVTFHGLWFSSDTPP